MRETSPLRAPREDRGFTVDLPGTVDASWQAFFVGVSAGDLQESYASARWWRHQVEANPGAYPFDLLQLLAEMEAAAECELAVRSAIPPSSPQVDLDLVKQRVDVAGYIRHRAGSRYRALRNGELLTRCPFPDHEDSDPSFYVCAAKQTFHCFGCGKGGDVFTFVMYWDGISFREAIAVLAWEAGLPKPRQPDRPAILVGRIQLTSGASVIPVRGGGRTRAR